MNVVLDTNVFLALCKGEVISSNVRAKIIRDCDPIFLTPDLFKEYYNVLKRLGLTDIIIQSNLQLFASYGKLKHKDETMNKIENIVTHEKDRHLIECAFYNNCVIITIEKNHLLNIRNEITAITNIQIFSPEEYLNQISIKK